MEEISPERAKELFPLMSTEKVLAATYLPTDGYLDPSRLCNSFAGEARRMGIKIFQQTRVIAINKEGNQVVSVTTDRGIIQTEKVVAACGFYTAEIARYARSKSSYRTYEPSISGYGGFQAGR